jgi:hypothetical protein
MRSISGVRYPLRALSARPPSATRSHSPLTRRPVAATLALESSSFASLSSAGSSLATEPREACSRAAKKLWPDGYSTAIESITSAEHGA